MDKEQIKYITNTHYKKLSKHVKSIVKDFDPEAIHQFRVTYKKLRAYLRMLSQEDDKTGEVKVSRRLKKAYNISGSIRDLQLQQQRILEATNQEPKKPQAYLTLLQKEIDKLKSEWIELISENPVAVSKKKTDAAIPDEFRLQDIQLFLQRKQVNINSILQSGDFSDDNVHAIRKNLKDLFYNLKISREIEPAISLPNKWNGKDEKYVDQLLDELGNFQDKCIAIALLKAFWINSLNAYNRELLERIKKRWIKEKVSIKQLLIKKLKTDIIPQAAVMANLA